MQRKNAPSLGFSPEVKLWYDRQHALQHLLRLHHGKARNRSNILRFAKRSSIYSPESWTTEEILAGIRECMNRKRQLASSAEGLRKLHLRECLATAQASNDRKKCASIKAIINRESVRTTWRLIKNATRDTSGNSVTNVTTVRDGVENHFRTKETVEKALQEEIGERFTLAHSAPIMKTYLGNKLYLLQDERLAREIIWGHFVPPPELDEATRMILGEISRIGKLICSGPSPDLGEYVVTLEDLRSYWSKVKESTSSSFSGVHFGHYKAGIRSLSVLNVMQKQINLVAFTGIAPKTWGTGLQVMLEKIAGVVLVNKLRAIQL